MAKFGFNTSILHGVDDKNPYGTTQVPIYQSSAFRHESAEELEKIFTNKAMGFSYTRINNPTVEAFEKRITLLEHGMASVACASGMAALANAIMNIVQNGDEIVASASLYGGTVELFEDLEAFGITVKYVEHNQTEYYEKLITERTRLIFAETIGNPMLDVTDIKALADMSHAYNLPLMIDNTVASPYLLTPIDLGADIVVHSSSKYINGNSDAISGIITWSGKFKFDPERYPGMKKYKMYGPGAYVAKLRNGLFRNMGACLSPQNAFLNLLGLETLGLRMERECANALALAKYLSEIGDGITVNYPGLDSHPDHELASTQLNGGYGAILTIRTGSKGRAFQIINSLKIPFILSNIGDTKTLVIHPASTISVHLTEEEQIASGVYDDLIRVSVGIEDIEDLKEDFRQAIESSN